VPLSAPAQDLQWTINDLGAKIPQVTDSALGTADGLLVAASQGLDRGQADELAAVACGLVSIVTGSTARMFGDDRVDIAVARLQRHVLMVKPVGEGLVLAVIATPDVDVSAAGIAIADLAEHIDQLITPDLADELQQALPP